MKPLHLDLFSGIGGFSLAAQWAGFDTIGFSEIDPYASHVLKKHWPAVTNYGDVRTVPTLRCDLITGGFPCQPFSLAGKRRGKADDRHLWPAMRDVIRRCQPTWICGENVPGIIGMELDQVLTDLESLGYRVQPLVVPACAVDAMHRRDRVWIVANAKSERGGTRHSETQPQHDRAGSASGSETLSDAEFQRLEGKLKVWTAETPDNRSVDGDHPCLWPVEPELGRVADGVSNRVDRLRALGNAIVPQAVFPILKAIHDLITA